jgi:glycosyltransferase involved in cell wall biosynthesis
MESVQRQRVLLISYYFPPMGTSGVLRAAKFAKYLPEFGWEPIVLTATPTAFFAFDPTLLEELEQRGIRIHRTPGDGNPWWVRRRASPEGIVGLPSERLHRFWLRLSQLWWIPDRPIRWKSQALELGRQLVRQYEPAILFATAPPFTDFLIAAELSEWSGLPYVVDYRDPWVGDPDVWYPTPWHRRRHRMLERRVLTRMARAVAVTRGIKEHLLRSYPELLTHEDVVIIPHGYDSEDFAAVGHVEPPSDRLVLSFVGTFKHSSPRTVLEALQRFFQQVPAARRQWEVRWVGLVRPEHWRMVEQLGLQDVVRVVGYVTHREAIRHMLESHVLWVESRSRGDSLSGSPVKFFEYLGARRTLLVCAPAGSPLRPLAESSGAAFWAERGDVATLTRHLCELHERWCNGTLPVPSEEFVRAFDRRTLTGELARLLSFHAVL